MGFIISKNNPIKMFMVGYPTVSDKYGVAGGILAGSTNVKFGDLVMFDTNAGYYKAVASASAVTDLAGFVVATNVKLADYFTNAVETKPGEAFNLLVNGFIAVALDTNAVATDIKPNASVYVTLATGKLNTATNASASTVVALPNVVFTGKYETQGTTLVAEILVK